MPRQQRHHRTRHRRILPWPEGEAPPEEVAAAARYVGSPEHKGAWSPHHEPRLRSDASECPVELSRDLAANTEALRRAIALRCVSADFEDGFPKYVWVWLDGGLWEARHIRGPAGTYKAYGPLEPVDFPLDRDGLLEAARGQG
jgi:hypothetical protein